MTLIGAVLSLSSLQVIESIRQGDMISNHEKHLLSFRFFANYESSFYLPPFVHAGRLVAPWTHPLASVPLVPPSSFVSLWRVGGWHGWSSLERCEWRMANGEW